MPNWSRGWKKQVCHGDVSADTKCVSGYVPLTHRFPVCDAPVIIITIRPPKLSDHKTIILNLSSYRLLLWNEK